MKSRISGMSRLVCIAVILVLSACSFPLTQLFSLQPTITPTIDPNAGTETATVQTEADAEEAYIFEEPPGGTTMLWMDNSTVVFVPGGDFIMGYDETQASDHRPAHTEALDAYWIYQAEVTNQMYAACVALDVCSPPDVTENEWYADTQYNNAPVTGVTYDQAQTYCEWVEARLPTEAEWELAARGTEGAAYPWGEEEPTCSLANYEDCLIPNEPQLVRSYPEGASPYNLADMAGNAAEWVFDWYGEEYYQTAPVNNPTGPETGTERVVRGSSFLTPEDELQIYLRSSLDPEEVRSDLGFRCVLTGEGVDTPVLPMCSILSYSPWPVGHPFPGMGIPIPDPTIQAYCNLDALLNQYGTMGIRVGHETNVDMAEFSSPNGALNCTQDANDPTLFNCIGSALHPGSQVIIHACQSALAGPLTTEPVCPPYYALNGTSHMCEYFTEPLMCTMPYVPVSGYGCLPPPDVQGVCPVGYYQGIYYGDAVCIPASGPDCCSPGAPCAAACPEGLVFNEGNFCCEYPQDLTPTCPTGYYLDQANNICLPDVPYNTYCRDYMVSVPSCAPQETPPPTGCLINVGVAAFQLECQAPCPVGVQNYGPCTP